jgi:hypothetical protein
MQYEVTLNNSLKLEVNREVFEYICNNWKNPKLYICVDDTEETLENTRCAP